MEDIGPRRCSQGCCPIQRSVDILAMISTSAPASCSRAADSSALCPAPMTITFLPRITLDVKSGITMRDHGIWQRTKLWRDSLKRTDTRRDNDSLGIDCSFIFENGAKSAFDHFHCYYFPMVEVGNELALEPLSVFDERRKRQRRFRRNSCGRLIRLQRA